VFGTGGFQKNINVVVGGNATGYISAMTLATSANKAFRNATVLAGAALAAFSVVMLTKAVGAAADFEHAMAGVKAVTQAVPKDFDRLIDKAKELGRITKFTMMDIAAGMEALGKAGFSTNEILFSMAGVADLAAAGGISLGEAADITSKAIRALGLDASDSTRIADVFAQAAASANVDVSLLGESMKYIAPLARAAGFSLEQTVAAIAKLGDVGIQGCYDDQTEVLTRRGWIKWEDASMSDEFATLNPDTNTLEYQQPSRLIRYHHSGQMYHVANRSLDMCVTPDHRMWAKRRDKDSYEVMRATEVDGKAVRYQTGGMDWKGVDRDHHVLEGFEQNRGSWTKTVMPAKIDSETWATFLGWYISEGHCDVLRGNYRIRIAQRSGAVRDRMRETLGSLPWTVNEDKNGFSIINEQLWREVSPLGKSYEKYIPGYAKEWSPRLLKWLLIALIEGDGDDNGAYYTSSSRLRDDVSEIALKLGYAASIAKRNPVGHVSHIKDGRVVTTKHDQWKVNIREEGLHPWYHPSEYKGIHGERLDQSRANACSEWIKYDGEVFCAEVPNHLLIVRRNGKSVVSGNSMAGTSLRFAFSELLATTDGFKESLSGLGMTMDDITGPDGKLMGFVEILTMLEEAGADTGDIITMMGKRAGPAIAALMQNVPGLREFTAELVNAAGAAKTMADIRLDTLRGQLEVLQGSWQLMLVTIGEKVTPIIQEFVEESLIPAVNEFAAWAEESDALEVKLRDFFDTMIDGFQWLLDNWETVVLGIKGITAALVALVAVKIITGIVALGTAIAGMGAATATAGVVAGTGAAAVGIALGSLLTLLAAAGIGLGLFLAKIKMAMRETKEYIEKAKELEAAMDAITGSWNEAAEAAKLMAGAVTVAKDELTAYLKEQYMAIETQDTLWASANDRWDTLRGMLKDNAKTVNEVTERMELLKEEILSSGAAANEMANMWAAGLEKILADFNLVGGGISAVMDRIQKKALETAQVIANSLSGLSISGLPALGTTGLGSFTGPTPTDTGLSFTGVPGGFLPEWGGVFGGPPAVAPGATTPDDIVAPWRDAMDDLRDIMTDTPTQATAALREFMTQFGTVPAALLAGSSAARSILSDLEELQRMGIGGLEADILFLEGLVGITAQEAAAKAKEATEQAKKDADELLQKQEEAAWNAADAMRVAFESKFTEPIAQALATGNWEVAAQAVRDMAVSFPELTAEAAEVTKVLNAVGMEGISQLDVLHALNGIGPELVSTMEGVIQLAKDAGDLDLAKALIERLENLFPEVEKTWKEKTVEWLDKGWAGVIDSAIGMLPGKLGEFASGIFDVFKKALTDPLGAISSALGVLQMVIQMFFEGILSRLQNELDALKEQEAALKEQEAELLDAMSFYVSTLQKIGSLMNSIFGKLGTIGQIANATITAFISSIEMLTLTGFDLLRAGVEMLTNLIGSLINAISGLIEKSDAYKAVQSEGARAWKAISDLFGQFLWPLAALLKHILDWLGIQTESNAAAEKAVEIGVPSIFKRAARAYESAAPGEIFTPEVVGGGVEIPSWATEIVEGIAGAIEGVLKKFGIDSWADLLEKFKAGSIRFWGYVENNIPKLVSALTSIFTTLSSAFGGGIVDTIVDWLRRGFDWFVNEGPGMVEKAVWFIGEVFGLAKSVLAWIQNNLKWEEIKALITSKFAEFKTFLGTILSLTDLLAQIGLVQGSISDVALAIDRVENQIEKMKTAMVYAMAIAAGAIIGGIAGAISAANPWLFGAPAVAAIIGAGVGALSAGFLAAIIARLTPGFAEGGMVPGPIGSPQLALVHGGESVLTRAQQQGSGAVIHNHISVFVGDDEIGARVVERIQHGGKSITGKYATAAGLTRRY